jgi:hypothetical protein
MSGVSQKGPCVTQRAAPLSITHLSHKERQAGMYVLALIFQKFQRRWTAPVSFMPRVFRATWAPGCASLGGLRGRAGYRCRWNPAWLDRSSRFACNCFSAFLLTFTFFSLGVVPRFFLGKWTTLITFSNTKTLDRLMLPLRGPDIRKVPRCRA